MWVRTDDGGAVNTTTAQHIYPIEEDGGWRLLFSSSIGTATSARLLTSREEAEQYLGTIIKTESHPPRVVNPGGSDEHQDTAGEGP